jgi:hypothetical protein
MGDGERERERDKQNQKKFEILDAFPRLWAYILSKNIVVSAVSSFLSAWLLSQCQCFQTVYNFKL